MQYRTWLRPGMMVKRWIIVLFVGILFTGLATAMGLAWLYRNYAFPDYLTELVQGVTLQFIPHPYREVVVFAPGLIFIIFGIYKLTKSLTGPFMETQPPGGSLAKIIETHRFGVAEPDLHIVTIGGGTGLSTLLRGLKHHNARITAIVTAGDDGGSSGRLRTEFNVPAPGDIRNCLVAMADSETLLSDLFQYRFDTTDSGLNGHSFGNLFITALTKVTGSFERAIIESGKVLNIRGSVVPSSIDNTVVGAEMIDGNVLHGETKIVESRQSIRKVFIEPANAEAYEPAIAAILSADLVVLGPGSLYTSVIPNLLVEGIAHAIRFTPAEKIYVCNVATQPGETDGFSVSDHIRALVDHAGGVPMSRILINSNLEPSKSGIKPEWGVSAVEFDGLGEFDGRIEVDRFDVVNSEFPLRHDPDKLASVLITIAEAQRARRGEHTGSTRQHAPSHDRAPRGGLAAAGINGRSSTAVADEMEGRK